MLCRIISWNRKRKTGSSPVYLNVYDLTPMNEYTYWFGFGIYHSGVEVHGIEYGFGAHDHSTTGVFEVEPKLCPGFTFRRSILIGTTDLGPTEVVMLMEEMAKEYLGATYHLITRNCNHFCNDVCIRLTQNAIPRWINRLARVGFLCNCVLPAELNDRKIRVARGGRRISEEAKKKLRGNSDPVSSSECAVSQPFSLLRSSPFSLFRQRPYRSTS